MRISIRIYTAVLVVALALSSAMAWGQGGYTAGELDELLGPIALYPDPLLAQIFPAATFPDQLAAAAQFSGETSAIDSQPWDVSVKAVAHYPQVLDMMVGNPDWTIAIGQAFVNQPTDVFASVQRLRAQAQSLGNLASNDQQQVSTQDGSIVIVPAQPQYIFVPQYNPQTVFVQPAPQSGVSPWVTFGTGLLIGAWLNNSINWHSRRVYYHGWSGGGWIGRSRPFVNWRNRRYVNPNWRNRPIHLDRNVNNRDIRPYRRQVQQGVGTFRPPAWPGTPTGPRPNVPGTRPTPPAGPGFPGGTRPGMPGVPSTRPSPPAGTGPGVRPGMPTVPSTRPGVPGARPGHPTTRPSAPGARPSHPTTRHGRHGVRPSHPTTRHRTPSTRPSGPPTSRPGNAGGGGSRGGR